MDAAENTAMSHHDELVLEHDYLNAKLMVPEGEKAPPGGREMLLTPNSHFYNIPVNTSVSSVHVPTNVFDGGELKALLLDRVLNGLHICMLQRPT
jgi:voltage-dependent calcium channel alpha-2/delta-3